MAAAEALVPGPAAAVAAAQSRRMAAVLLGWVEPVMRLHLRWVPHLQCMVHRGAMDTAFVWTGPKTWVRCYVRVRCYMFPFPEWRMDAVIGRHLRFAQGTRPAGHARACDRLNPVWTLGKACHAAVHIEHVAHCGRCGTLGVMCGPRYTSIPVPHLGSATVTQGHAFSLW